MLWNIGSLPRSTFTWIVCMSSTCVGSQNVKALETFTFPRSHGLQDEPGSMRNGAREFRKPLEAVGRVPRLRFELSERCR